MTQDGQKIDWKKILLEMRDSYTCDDSVYGDRDARYQSEFESYSQRMTEWFPNFEVDRREDAERQRNIFAAIEMYYNVAAPIPPELIATLLSLYNDVYLRSEREVTLEEVFFNHYGDSQYRTKWKKENRDALDDLSVALDTQFHGLTKTEAAERRGEYRGVTGNAVLSNIRRKRKQSDKLKEDK